MPTYDFRCRECGFEREVMASFAEAEQLSLACSGCGSDMTRSVSAGVAVVRSRTTADPASTKHDHRPGHRCGSCASAVRLDRPSPFTSETTPGSAPDDA